MKNYALLLSIVFIGILCVTTAESETYDGVEIPEGAVAFADEVVSYTPGPGVGANYSDPQKITGEPDYLGFDVFPINFVSLGDNGEIVIRFTDNVLTTSGNADNDLWLFEIGEVEPSNIAISTDGVNWVSVGSTAGSTSGVDIDAFLSSGVVLWEQYKYVRITDAGEGLTTGEPYPGVDIDTVAAISSDPANPEDYDPRADAGGDQTVEGNEVVTLDGSLSSDPDGSIVSYEWSQLSGISISLSSTSAVKPTFTAPDVTVPGAVIFQLLVTDDDNLTDTDKCVVNIIPEGSSYLAPIAIISPISQSVEENVVVTLDGSNSVDPDGTIVSFEWSQVSGTPVTLSDASAIKPTFMAPDVGASGDSLEFELIVTDNDNLKGSADSIVNVGISNRPPIANAGPNQTVTKNTTVTLDGSGSSDPDPGDVLAYLWSQISGPAVSVTNATSAIATFTAPDTDTGVSLQFKLTVTDNGNLKGFDSCYINVTSSDVNLDGSVVSGNSPPVANAGEDRVVAPGATVALDGSGSSDAEDGVLTDFIWTQLTGPSVTLSDPLSSGPIFTAPIVSEDVDIEFELTVTDSGGFKDSDTVVLTVSPTAASGSGGGGGSSGWCFINSLLSP